MNTLTAYATPHPGARSIGVVYFLYFLTAISAQVFIKGIIVSGDAVATARNLDAHESVFRLGIALGLISIAWYIALTAQLYQLFKPVHQNISLIAACFSFLGCAIQSFACLFQLIPSLLLHDAPYLHVFNLQQLQALNLLLLKFGAQAFNAGLIFFGFYCLLLGCLIFQSAFLPKPLGLLMACAGLGWLSFLSPHLVISLSPYIQILGVLAEAALMFWLLIFGVDAERWKKRIAGAL